MTDGAPRIHPAGRACAPALADHLARHFRESGRAGAPHFAPVIEIGRSEAIDAMERRWSTPLDVPGWGRAWLVWVPSTLPEERGGRVVGHVELRGGLIPAALHRAEISIGLEQPWVGRGLGTRLFDLALRFAEDEARLAWVDLRVFSENQPARRLYDRAGFTEVGRVREAFRLHDGTRIDDVMMVRAMGAGR